MDPGIRVFQTCEFDLPVRTRRESIEASARARDSLLLAAVRTKSDALAVNRTACSILLPFELARPASSELYFPNAKTSPQS